MTTTTDRERADRIFEQPAAIAIDSVVGAIVDSIKFPGADTTPSAKP